MSDITKHLDTPWLKAKVNVQNGDHIRFDDEGVDDTDQQGNSRLKLGVTVIRGQEEITSKFFSPNRTNLKEIVKCYGTESADWVGKEMLVAIEKVRNPQTGEKVDSVALYAPGSNPL